MIKWTGRASTLKYQQGKAMIRSIVRSLIFLVLLFTVGGYLIYLKTGVVPIPSRLLSSGGTGDSGRVDLRRLSEMPSMNSVDPTEKSEDITKWQDENGVWHFSNE